MMYCLAVSSAITVLRPHVEHLQLAHANTGYRPGMAYSSASSKVNDQCFKLVGRFINHDDAIETGILKDAFDRTASLWKQRYNQLTRCVDASIMTPGAIKKLKGLLGKQ